MSWLADRLGIHVNSINDITSGRAIKETLRNPLVMGAGSLALPGVGALAGGLGAAASKIPGVAKVASAGQAAAKSGFGSKVLGGLKKVGTFAKDNPDLLLAAGSAYEGINANNDANKFRDRALAMAEADAASRGQFRDMAMSRLGGAQRPDLGSIFGGSGNPYAAGGSIPRVGSGAPAPSAPGVAPPMIPPGRPLLARVGQRVNAKRPGGM